MNGKCQTGSARAIMNFLKRLENQGICMHGFLLMHRDEILAEGYWKPFRAEIPHRMYSVSKSMTSLAIGLLIGEGKISFEDAIIKYFADMLPPTVPPQLNRLTIRDMLRMATCYARTTYREGEDRDWIRTYFHSIPDHEPGTVFSYDTSASQVLAALVERITGMPLIDFLQQRVFDKIGASDRKYWLTDPSGVSQGGSGLCMTLRDLAKVSALILRGGDGILPAEYLSAATAKQTETVLQGNREERHGYGYQFWRTRNGYAMYGMGGQLAVFVPDREVLLCTVADTRLEPNGVQQIYDAFFDILLPGLGGSPEGNAGDAAELEEQLRNLVCPVIENNQKDVPVTANEYRMENSPLNITAIRLHEDCLEFDKPDGSYRMKFALGKNALGEFPGSNQPCMTSAGWIAPRVFRIRSYIIGDSPCGIDMLLTFKDNTLTIHSRRSHDSLTAEFEGMSSGYASSGCDALKG